MSLGLSIYHASGDFQPRIEFNAKSGRMCRVDRTADGTDTIKVDVTMQQPAYAWDIGSIEIGWANFQAATVPSMVMVPYGQSMPERPNREHKAGFKSKLWDGREATARQFCATAGVTVIAIEALWDQLAAAPEAAAGKVPVLRLVDVSPITTGRGTNYAPVFTVLQWIARDETVFGPRTVAAPGQPPIVLTLVQTTPAAPAALPPAAWETAAPAIVDRIAQWPVAA
jgi:hypothetical protein